MQYYPHKYYIIKNSVDSVIITINDDNAFLVNLNDASYKKLFNDDSLDDILKKLDKDELSKFIYAKIISISPDGKYLLYISNRNYILDKFYNSFDIYSYDLITGKETKIMNFNDKEFLCWENPDINPGASGNFLFRESGVSKTDGQKIYSPIRRYSITQEKEDVFLNIKINDEKVNIYEMIDERYFYATENKINEKGVKEITIYIGDIYSTEIITARIEKYSAIWHVLMSENKEYIAFFGSYINNDGFAFPDVLTLNLGTNHLVSHYEQNDGIYFIDSFYWCPDNILAVNFQNTVDLYKDLCRLHIIDHK